MSRTDSKIVRRPDFAGGGITPEEKARMDEHAKLWIKRAMRTDPIEPDKIVPAIEALYRAAELDVPRVVIVPSPLVMAIAGGFASAIWHAREGKRFSVNAATSAATYDATLAATRVATRDATRAATDAATRAATDAATRAATRDATLDATLAATRVATRAATRAATDAATRAATDAATVTATRDATLDATYDATLAATLDATLDATRAATEFSWIRLMALEFASGDQQLADLMIACISRWYSQYQGGNMWAAWDCYLTAARDILGLRLPAHAKYEAWEQAAIHGGYRLMNPNFCMVCDFPEVLRVDAQNRPHCSDGPSHRWRDGWSLYYWHGVQVPEHIIERPKTITVTEIAKESNAEVRRVMIERYGAARYLLDSGAKIVQRDSFGLLYRKDVPDDEPIVMVRVLNSTPEPDGVMSRDEAIATFGDAAKCAKLATKESRWKEYMLRVPPTVQTAHEGIAWTFNMKAEDYAPELET